MLPYVNMTIGKYAFISKIGVAAEAIELSLIILLEATVIHSFCDIYYPPPRQMPAY